MIKSTRVLLPHVPTEDLAIQAKKYLRWGPFITLASKNDDGTENESNFYWNGRRLICDPNGGHYAAEAMALALRGMNIDYVCGIAEGSIMLAGNVSQALLGMGYYVPALWCRKAAKDHGTGQLIEGLDKNERLDGKRVAVVEDVFTTGKSSQKAVTALHELGAEVVIDLAIADRGDSADENFAKAGLPWGALVNLRELLPADVDPITRVKLAA